MTRVVGVDENGLGPRLGPLVATAATLCFRTAYDAERYRKVGFDLGIGDSKQTGAFGKMAHIESLALAVAERALGKEVRTPDALLDAISIDGRLALRAPCPSDETAQQCWSEPMRLPVFGGELAHGKDLLRQLKKQGVVVERVRSALACPGVLNDALDRGVNKLAMDLHLFERLIADAHAAAGEQVLALCGQVGGIKRYQDRFALLEEPRVLYEDAERGRAYETTQAELRFEVKADDRHLPVGVASMVGKYVREIGMRRVVQFYRTLDETLPEASGYHDSVTRRFVEESAIHRKRLKIATPCFERRK